MANYSKKTSKCYKFPLVSFANYLKHEVTWWQTAKSPRDEHSHGALTSWCYNIKLQEDFELPFCTVIIQW